MRSRMKGFIHSIVSSALFAKAVEFYLIFSNSSNRSYEQAAGARTGTFFLVFGLVMAHTALWYFLYMFVGGPVLCQSFQSSADFYYWYVGCLPSNTTDDNLYIILTIALTSAFNLFAVILLAIAWDIVSVYNLAQCIIFVVRMCACVCVCLISSWCLCVRA